MNLDTHPDLFQVAGLLTHNIKNPNINNIDETIKKFLNKTAEELKINKLEYLISEEGKCLANTEVGVYTSGDIIRNNEQYNNLNDSQLEEFNRLVEIQETLYKELEIMRKSLVYPVAKAYQIATTLFTEKQDVNRHAIILYYAYLPEMLRNYYSFCEFTTVTEEHYEQIKDYLENNPEIQGLEELKGLCSDVCKPAIIEKYLSLLLIMNLD